MNSCFFLCMWKTNIYIVIIHIYILNKLERIKKFKKIAWLFSFTFLKNKWKCMYSSIVISKTERHQRNKEQ